MIGFNMAIAKQVGAPVNMRQALCYFIHGQSNAKGTTLLSNHVGEPVASTIPNAFAYYKPNGESDTDGQFDVDNGIWTPMYPNYNVVSQPNDYGPERMFAYEMQGYIKREIFVIKFAIGNTGLNTNGALDWAPGSGGEMFERAINNFWIPARDKLIQYGRIPVVKAGLWMQGEWDAGDSGAATLYNANLTAILAAFRSALVAPSMHWSIGRLHASGASQPFKATVRTAQAAVGALANNSWIDTDAYVLRPDVVHYLDHSDLGHDFYLKVKDL